MYYNTCEKILFKIFFNIILITYKQTIFDHKNFNSNLSSVHFVHNNISINIFIKPFTRIQFREDIQLFQITFFFKQTLLF